MKQQTLNTFMRGYVLGVATSLTAALLAGCLTDPEPKTITISCGTLSATDDWEAPPDTFSVEGGECRSIGEVRELGR
jgi:hypothetical protein